MKKLFTVFLLVVISAFFLASTSAAAPPPEGLYRAELKGSLTVGKDGRLTLRIVPAKGYKWNKQYPAKLKFTDGTKISFAKKQYRQLKGEMTPENKNCKVEFTAKGNAAGRIAIDAEMSFSVCNEETCHVLRKRKLKISVNVK
jgi:hypothetical protein